MGEIGVPYKILLLSLFPHSLGMVITTEVGMQILDSELCLKMQNFSLFVLITFNHRSLR